MKYFISLLIFLILSFSFIVDDKIIVTAKFENPNNSESFSGTFYIKETNETIQMNSFEDFNFSLPSKGRYNFVFSSKNYVASLTYPDRFTHRNNVILIELILISPIKNLYKGLHNNKIFTKEELNIIWESNEMKFIIHGLNNSTPQSQLDFTNKYGIGFSFQNCVIDPIAYRKASENNKLIHDFLNEKFGNSWKSELFCSPIGFKKD